MKSISAPVVRPQMNLLHVGRYFRSSSVPSWRKWVGFSAVLYVLSPIDLIPDVLPVIGWLDDVGVLGLALTFVTRDMARFAKQTAANVQTIEVEPSARRYSAAACALIRSRISPSK